MNSYIKLSLNVCSCCRDNKRKLNDDGAEYGWHIKMRWFKQGPYLYFIDPVEKLCASIMDLNFLAIDQEFSNLHMSERKIFQQDVERTAIA
jgi:hypothetical protein